MTVTDKSFYHLEHQGQTQYFCGAKCKQRFATSGQRHTSAGLAKTALPATNASHHRLTWRTGGLLSLALLSALLVGWRWLQSQ
jgi:YHS domain-containing protein